MSWHGASPEEGLVAEARSKKAVLTKLASLHDDSDPSTRKVKPGLYEYRPSSGAGQYWIGREEELRAAGWAWAFDGERNPHKIPDDALRLPALELVPGEHQVSVAGQLWEPVIATSLEEGDDQRTVVRLTLGSWSQSLQSYVRRTFFSTPRSELLARPWTGSLGELAERRRSR